MPSTNGHGPEPERIALYLRVSSEEQRDRETIEIQREFLERYRQLYGLEVAEIYEDDGISGTIPLHERPNGRRLIQDAQKGKFRTVVVKKLDRLGRSLLVIVDAHDRLDATGVSLRSATEPIDTSTPSGRLIFQMLASFAEYDRESIRERTQAGLHRAFRNGKYMGRISYGYSVGADARLEVVPEEAAIVREIIANIAGGSTLYREAKRLNDLGLPSPGTRYPGSERKPGRSWSATTISNIVHQETYSGVHKVRVNGGEECIERESPAIVTMGLQERARAMLGQNKRYHNRKTDRNYLLAGLVKCAVCGYACTGHTATARGKKYHYYACIDGRTEKLRQGPPHRSPYLSAKWLEELVWSDVRRFLENPGEVLERVREQLRGEDDTQTLAQRGEDLTRRLVSKTAEKDRYVRLYAQGHISEPELEVYLTDLKNQTNNIGLLIESVEANLSEKQQRKELAETTHAWLLTLRQRVAEVEEDTAEAFQVRKQLVRLLVAGIAAGKRDGDGSTEVRITYRFNPPDEKDEEDMFVGALQNPTSLSNAKQPSRPRYTARCLATSPTPRGRRGSRPHALAPTGGPSCKGTRPAGSVQGPPRPGWPRPAAPR
jgi:site-specific DNA recombinase